MDIDAAKIGVWPNVAIEAGTDPAVARAAYGVDTREKQEAENGPFCETVKRWLEGDAPDECHGCKDGCWEELHAKLAAECDTCEPANSMQAEIMRLREAIDALESGTMYALYREACEERDRLQRVVRIQADSFADLERELAEMRRGGSGA